MKNTSKLFKNVFNLFGLLRSFYDKVPEKTTDINYEELINYLEKIKHFHSTGPHCYYIADLRKLMLIEAGGSMHQLIGYQPDEVKGRNFAFGLRIFPLSCIPDIIKGLIKYHQYVQARNLSSPMAIKAAIFTQVKNGRGGSFMGLLQAAPVLFDSNGNITAMYTSVTDISHFCLPVSIVKVDIIDESDPNSVKVINVVNEIISETFLLTKSELKILNAVRLGKNTKEIAQIFFISEHTVNTHRKNIMQKLDAKNTAELVSKTIHL